MGSRASPYFSDRSARVVVSRAVAATLSPRSRAAMDHSRPNPRDVPVMNQIFSVIVEPSVYWSQGFKDAIGFLIPDLPKPPAGNRLPKASVWAAVVDASAKHDVLQRSSIPVDGDPEQADGKQHAGDRADQSEDRTDPLRATADDA